MSAESELVTKGVAWFPRICSFLIGAAFVGFSAFCGINPPDALVAAANCQAAPAGCAVKVSGQADPAVIVAGFLLGALFLLIAITGLIFKLVLPGGGSLEPIAHTVTEKPADFVSETAPVDADQGTSVEARNERWLRLPADVRGAVEKLWFEWDPSTTMAPGQALLRVDRKGGKGPHPYFLTFKIEDAKSRIMKVTLSGRGYTGPRASEDE